MLEAEIKVTGRVQGVFFRYSAKKQADKLGVVGTVRNQSDGSVKIIAQGDEDFLERFIEWTRKGPELAEVTGFEIKRKSIQEPTYRDFTVER